MKLSCLLLAGFASISLHAELFFTPQMIAKHLETYTDKEIQLLEKDLAVVRSICLDDTHNADSLLSCYSRRRSWSTENKHSRKIYCYPFLKKI